MLSIGWKTIVGSILYAAGQALPAAWPDAAPVGPYLCAAGAVLGGVGVAHKGAKVLEAIERANPPQER